MAAPRQPERRRRRHVASPALGAELTGRLSVRVLQIFWRGINSTRARRTVGPVGAPWCLVTRTKGRREFGLTADWPLAPKHPQASTLVIRDWLLNHYQIREYILCLDNAEEDSPSLYTSSYEGDAIRAVLAPMPKRSSTLPIRIQKLILHPVQIFNNPAYWSFLVERYLRRVRMKFYSVHICRQEFIPLIFEIWTLCSTLCNAMQYGYSYLHSDAGRETAFHTVKTTDSILVRENI